MAKIILIVAYDCAYGIGNNGDLLYSLPADLKRFKELTSGHTVVMGRKTWQSIGKKLPNRKNIVISSSQQLGADLTTSDINDVLNLNETVYVIGGESIYKLFLQYADILEITKIDEIRAADTKVEFFFSALDNFSLHSRHRIRELEKKSKRFINIEFLTYLKK